MKPLILILLLLSGCVPALPQNLIQNGAMQDTNRDALADYWDKGYFVTAFQIRDGQYLESHATYCPQVTIYQDMKLEGTQGKKYVLSFDLSNSTEIWVRFYFDQQNFNQVTTIPAGENQRHMVEYYSVYPKITKVLFSSPAGHWCWMLLDNVVMVDGTQTGIAENTTGKEQIPEYISIFGEKLTRPEGFYIEKRGNQAKKVYKCVFCN